MDIHVKPPARVAETPLTPQPPALVLFGRGGGKPRAAWFEAAESDAATAAATTMQLRTLALATDEQRALAEQLARGRVLPSGRALVPFVKRDLYTRLVAFAGEEAGLQISSGGPDRVEPSADEDAAKGTAEPGAAAGKPAEARGDEPVGSEASGANEPAGTAGPAAPSTAPDQPAKPKSGEHNFVGQRRPGDRDEIGLGSIVLAHEGPDEGWWEAEVIGCNGRVFSLRWRDYPLEGTILRKAGELALLPPGEA